MGTDIYTDPATRRSFTTPPYLYDPHPDHAPNLRAMVEQVRDTDPVNHPAHYTRHPSGVECIQITEHMTFCMGNAVKYIWRAGEKGNQLQDLKKARWYIDREISRLEGK